MVQMRIAAVLILIIGLTAVSGSMARDEKKADPKDDKKADPREKLVGVWVVVKSELPPESTLEFGQDGNMKLTVALKDMPRIYTNKWALDGTNVKLTDPIEGDLVLKIVELTDSKLVFKDGDDKSNEFKKLAKAK
jgi:uncharacterized protein (TIGR03066 family)